MMSFIYLFIYLILFLFCFGGFLRGGSLLKEVEVGFGKCLDAC